MPDTMPAAVVLRRSATLWLAVPPSGWGGQQRRWHLIFNLCLERGFFLTRLTLSKARSHLLERKVWEFLVGSKCPTKPSEAALGLGSLLK